MILWAIIPVKPLRYSKSRLSHILSMDERAQLTSDILERTISAVDQVPVITKTMVISRDTAALKVARKFGVSTYRETEKQDLNTALIRAAHIAAAQKAEGVLILPADLPLVTSADIEELIEAVGLANPNGSNGYSFLKRVMVICTDRNQDGTNALLVSPPTAFTYQYGPNSFERHLNEAEKLGMTIRTVTVPNIEFDLDTEEDWHIFQQAKAETELLTMVADSS
jgi:2-phospho-L-lactate guanylyltransferase